MGVLGSVRKALAIGTAATVMAVLGTVAPAGALIAPVVPAAIAVPAGNAPFLVGHATGYQIYRCTAGGPAPAWTLLQPWAGLRDDNGNWIALHYGGPTWQAPDGSAVVAARVASAPAPGGTAIPWLLLQKVSTSGPANGTLAPTTYIQRINTTGGLAPATGCDSDHIGATAAVSYTADYWFYRAANAG